MRTSPLVFASAWFFAFIAGCGPGVRDESGGPIGMGGTSRLGESCGSRADCVLGLTCKDQTCKVDKSTTRSCQQIEAAYTGALQTPSNSACNLSSECARVKGLCGSDVVEAATVNTTIKLDLDALDEEWENNGCDMDVRCADAPTGLFCSANKCVDSAKCGRAVDAVCTSASGFDCRVYMSSYNCSQELPDLVDCNDSAVADDALMYIACVNAINPVDCSTKDAFIDQALAACGSLLGMQKR